MVIIESTAWVPDDGSGDSWVRGSELAVEWVLREASERGQEPLLVTPTQSAWTSGAPAISWMASRYEATTPRGTRPSHGHRPVLVYVPDYDVMSFAFQFARGSAMAVIEDASDPLRGWAAEAGAIDLLSGDVARQVLEAEIEEEYDRIHMNGNNGWASGFGSNQTARILRRLNEAGRLDPDDLIGRMLARGHNGRHLNRLSALIGKL